MTRKKFVIEDFDHVRGSRTAPVMLLEYGDYQCEYCIAAEPLVRKILRNFKKETSFIFRNFPITNVHPKAFAMACYAESTKTEKAFWKAHDDLFAGKIPSALVLKRSRANEIARKKVDTDISIGIHSGVNGTPTFFINGKRYDGEHEYHAMSEYIQKLLDKRKKK